MVECHLDEEKRKNSMDFPGTYTNTAFQNLKMANQ